MPFRILSVSYDRNLLATRQLLLEQQGYSVVSAEGFIQALERCQQGSYDLVVIGHSIPVSDKQGLLDAIDRHCGVPVISLIRQSEPDLPGVAAEIDPHDPKAFMAAVKRILATRGASTG
jgi:CheY-like chemotaxis protein